MLMSGSEQVLNYFDAYKMTTQKTILLVDDDDRLINSTKLLIEILGHRVFAASSGKEALDIYEQHVNDIDLVVIDFRMPDMDGKSTYLGLKAINDRCRAYIYSGFVDDRFKQELRSEGVLDVLAKPVSLDVYKEILQ